MSTAGEISAQSARRFPAATPPARWPLEKSPQPLSGYITLHIGHITGREGVALQGPRQGVALAPEKNDVTRFHIVLSVAHFSSGAKVLCDKGRDIAYSQVSVSPTRGRGLSMTW